MVTICNHDIDAFRLDALTNSKRIFKDDLKPQSGAGKVRDQKRRLNGALLLEVSRFGQSDSKPDFSQMISWEDRDGALLALTDPMTVESEERVTKSVAGKGK